MPISAGNRMPAPLGPTLWRRPARSPDRKSAQAHDDAVRNGQRVLIVDDLLATGGTASATCELVKRLGGEVWALAFLIELAALNGRQKLDGERIHAVLKY